MSSISSRRSEIAAAALFIAIGVGLSAACSGPPAPPVRPPYRPNTTCAEACGHLRALGCVEGTPTKKGIACETVCEDANASGVARYPTDCLVVQTSCAELRTCK